MVSEVKSFRNLGKMQKSQANDQGAREELLSKPREGVRRRSWWQRQMGLPTEGSQEDGGSHKLTCGKLNFLSLYFLICTSSLVYFPWRDLRGQLISSSARLHILKKPEHSEERRVSLICAGETRRMGEAYQSIVGPHWLKGGEIWNWHP